MFVRHPDKKAIPSSAVDAHADGGRKEQWGQARMTASSQVFTLRMHEGPTMKLAKVQLSVLPPSPSRGRPCAHRQGDSSAVACWSRPCGLMGDGEGIWKPRDCSQGRTAAKFSRFAPHRHREGGLDSNRVALGGWHAFGNLSRGASASPICASG